MVLVSPKKLYAILAVLVLLSTALWWHFFGAVSLVGGDSAFYHGTAVSLLEGKGYVWQGAPTMFREPLYPLFMAVLYLVSGVQPFAVQITQMFLLFLAACLTYEIGVRLYSKKLGTVAAILVAVYPVLNNYTSRIYSEILACFVVTLLVYFWVRAAEKQSSQLFFTSGVCAGLLILTKVIFLFLPIAVGVAAVKNKKFLLFVLGAALVVTPWTARNYVQFGTPSIASRSGVVLYVHAIHTTYNLSETGKFLASSFFGEYFVRRFVDPSYVFEQDSIHIDTFASSPDAQGVQSPDEFDMRLSQAAVKLIAAHPVAYLLWGVLEVHNLYSPLVYAERHFSLFHDNPQEHTILKVATLLLLDFAWWLFVFLSWYGMYRLVCDKRPGGWLIPLLFLGVSVELFFFQGYPRSLMPLLPLSLLSATYAVLVLTPGQTFSFLVQ